MSQFAAYHIFRKQTSFFRKCVVFHTTPGHLWSERQTGPTNVRKNKTNTSLTEFETSEADLHKIKTNRCSLSPVEGFQGEVRELSWEEARAILKQAEDFSDEGNQSVQGVQDILKTVGKSDISFNGKESEDDKCHPTFSYNFGNSYYKLVKSILPDRRRTGSKRGFEDCNKKHFTSFCWHRSSMAPSFEWIVTEQVDNGPAAQQKGGSWCSATFRILIMQYHDKPSNSYQHPYGSQLFFDSTQKRGNLLLNERNLFLRHHAYPHRLLFTDGRQQHNLSKYSTGNPNESTPLSQKARLKKAVKEYGATVVVFHVGISLVSLGGFYALVSSGIDVVSLLIKLGLPESYFESKVAAGASTFVIAYAVHKVFAPVRIAITLTSVPFIVRYLRRIGFLKNPDV